MIGIPYRLERDSDEGVVDKTIYLGTRRRDAAGATAMKKAKKEYRKYQMAMGKAHQCHTTSERRIVELPADHEKTEGLIELRDKQYDELAAAEANALEAAEKLVGHALVAAGYTGDAKADVLAVLSDEDYHNMVITIQAGEQPKDFLQSPEQLEKPTTTSLPGDSALESSSSEDLPGDK